MNLPLSRFGPLYAGVDHLPRLAHKVLQVLAIMKHQGRDCRIGNNNSAEERRGRGQAEKAVVTSLAVYMQKNYFNDHKFKILMSTSCREQVHRYSRKLAEKLV